MAEWVEGQYNSASLALGGGTLHCVVSWAMKTKSDPSPGGYTVSVGRRKLKELSPDMTHGKRRAEAFAKRLIADMLADLETVAKEPV